SVPVASSSSPPAGSWVWRAGARFAVPADGVAPRADGESAEQPTVSRVASRAAKNLVEIEAVTEWTEAIVGDVDDTLGAKDAPGAGAFRRSCGSRCLRSLAQHGDSSAPRSDECHAARAAPQTPPGESRPPGAAAAMR